MDEIWNVDQGEWGGRRMWNSWESREKFSKFWWESPKERGHSEDRGVDGSMESEWLLGTLAGGGGAVDSVG
jgi:hypothetical protein